MQNQHNKSEEYHEVYSMALSAKLQVESALKEVKLVRQDIKILFDRLWVLAGAVVLLLLSVVGYLYSENQVLLQKRLHKSLEGKQEVTHVKE
jgi:hypothetical protein